MLSYAAVGRIHALSGGATFLAMFYTTKMPITEANKCRRFDTSSENVLPLFHGNVETNNRHNNGHGKADPEYLPPANETQSCFWGSWRNHRCLVPQCFEVLRYV